MKQQPADGTLNRPESRCGQRSNDTASSFLTTKIEKKHHHDCQDRDKSMMHSNYYNTMLCAQQKADSCVLAVQLQMLAVHVVLVA